MDLKIIEKLFLLLVRSQIRQWAYTQKLGRLHGLIPDAQDKDVISDLEKQTKYLEERLRA